MYNDQLMHQPTDPNNLVVLSIITYGYIERDGIAA